MGSDAPFLFSRGPLKIEAHRTASGALCLFVAFGLLRHEVEIPRADAERLLRWLDRNVEV